MEISICNLLALFLAISIGMGIAIQYTIGRFLVARRVTKRPDDTVLEGIRRGDLKTLEQTVIHSDDFADKRATQYLFRLLEHESEELRDPAARLLGRIYRAYSYSIFTFLPYEDRRLYKKYKSKNKNITWSTRNYDGDPYPVDHDFIDYLNGHDISLR